MLCACRKKFESFSVKVGLLFSKIPLHPNHWTLLSIVPVLISFYFLLQQEFLLASFFFILSAFLDLVDGSVARVSGRVSKFGAFLDTIMDRYVEAIIVFALLFLPLPKLILSSKYWIFLYLFGAMMTTYVKAAAKEKELVEKELRGGLLERAERMILLFLGLVSAHFNLLYLVYVLILLAVFSNLTAFQRILKARTV